MRARCSAVASSSRSPIVPSAPAGRSSVSAAATPRTSSSPIASSTKPTAARSRCVAARARASKHHLLQPRHAGRDRTDLHQPGAARRGVGPRLKPARRKGRARKQSTPSPAGRDATPGGIVRNISFRGIHATVADPAAGGRAVRQQLQSRRSQLLHHAERCGDGFHGATSVSTACTSRFPAAARRKRGGPRCAESRRRILSVGVPPVYGLFARNVRGLTLKNVRFEMAAPDLRPALVFDHVADAAVNGFSVQGNSEAESVLRFISCQDVCSAPPGCSSPKNISAGRRSGLRGDHR